MMFPGRVDDGSLSAARFPREDALAGRVFAFTLDSSISPSTKLAVLA